MARKRKEVKSIKATNRRSLEVKEHHIKAVPNKKKAVTGYETPKIIDGVVPDGKSAAIAQDSYTHNLSSYVGGINQFYGTFMGYQKLAMLTQSTDYRCVFETSASEMTREWGKIKSNNNDDDKTKGKIEKLEARFKELDICALIRKHIENEMIFGRSQIFIDIKGHDDDLDVPLTVTGSGVPKGSLRGFKLIEAMWTTPQEYNSFNPLADDFYVPSKWYVMGKIVHSDRLITLISRPVPDLLKASYNFSGISMIQLMEPYVERWQRNVDSISELIHSFSLTGLKTDMSSLLADDTGHELIKRARLYSAVKDNQELMLLDKDGEEFFQFNTPLSTLDTLMQKSQEQMAAPSHTPLVKLIGVTPSGMNASSKEEISVYYDYIAAWQNNHLLPQIKRILDILQLDMFGEIDESIFFQFNPLEQMNELEQASISKTKAERDASLIQNGIISQEESRERLSKDEQDDYSGISADDLPEVQDDLTLEEYHNEASEKQDNT